MDKIQDPLDPSTKCQPRIRRDSRSSICLERSLDRIGPFIIEQNLPLGQVAHEVLSLEQILCGPRAAHCRPG